MSTQSLARLILINVIVCAALSFITSVTTETVNARLQADLIVNPGESIQAAIDAANNGDMIIVNAGDYTESLTLILLCQIKN